MNSHSIWNATTKVNIYVTQDSTSQSTMQMHWNLFKLFYIHYKVTKYLEKFEKKDKSERDKEIDNLFEWNPKD